MHRLPHTWDAFFTRFGRFTEIQAQAIDPLLAGRNCILVAATASGKTEAALAPLIERQRQARTRERRTSQTEPHQLKTIYIVPTRALVHDLTRRLAEPVARLGIRMRAKTGDDPPLDSSRPPELLLTTPESFDSLLTHRPRLVRHVRAVVLDEIHLYDNTARGDGLRVLMNRLRRIKHYAVTRGETTNEDIQYCALSATLDDPANVAARYFDNPLVVQASDKRAIDAEFLEIQDVGALRELFATFQSRGVRKALAFCESRAQCEEFAHTFRAGTPFGERVFVHHAGLDKRVRQNTEREFNSSTAALCFATSTLELGIDIGDVDLILLTGAPRSIGSFLQRTGRGNRRTSRTAVVCCYRTTIEQAVFNVLLRGAMHGEIERRNYLFRSSVVVQQLCSYIKQTPHGEINPEQAFGLFTSPEGEPLIAKREYDGIIEHLIAKGYFVSRGGMLHTGARWRELYERQAIYSNLSGVKDTRNAALDVFDEATGRRLGETDGRGQARAQTFLLAGHVRRARLRTGNRLIVQSIEDAATTNRTRRAAGWRPMPPQLAQAVGEELGLVEMDSPSGGRGEAGRRNMRVVTEVITEDANGAEISAASESPPPSHIITRVLHCAGEAYGIVLGDLLERACQSGTRLTDYNEMYITLEGELPTELQLTARQVEACVMKRWRQFEGWFEPGGYQTELPLEARQASVVRSFDITEFLRLCSNLKREH